MFDSYFECDWDQARKDGTGTPQATVKSLYLYIESELRLLGLFDNERPQGGGLPLMSEDLWGDLKGHIEGTFLSLFHPALFHPNDNLQKYIHTTPSSFTISP